MQSSFYRNARAIISVSAGASYLKLGSYDPSAVTLVQMGLAILGFQFPRSKRRNGMMDGIFGAETDHNVRSFQSRHGLNSDGVVGPVTIGLLDQLLAPLPLSPAPAQMPAIAIVPDKIDVSSSLRKLNQPDAMSCWAAAGTMLWEIHNPTLVSKFINTWSATERINDVLQRADAKKVASNGFFQGEFKRQNGLDVANSVNFFQKALGLTRAGEKVSERVLGIYGWLVLLSAAKGPAAANSIRIADHIFNHWFMITGADSTKVKKNEYAPPPPFPELTFLYAGVLSYYDPQKDTTGEMSIADADARLGVLPDWVDPTIQYRGRVFY